MLVGAFVNSEDKKEIIIMNDKEIIKQLKEGSFYMVFEGSKDGHPGMIYWKNDQANLYLAVTTGSTEFNNPHFEKLPDPTS